MELNSANQIARESTALPALRIEGVVKRFENFTALHDVNLDVHSGEMLCFLGPSGCGKTTLLRVIAGLETQTAGCLLQYGRNISWAPPAARDYGIVFQSYALFPNLTVADNVAYGLVNRKTPRSELRRRTDELLALVGLPSAGSKFPSQLSGGQQQRVALARALAMRPRLLLLDEPLSALDAIERVRLRAEIRRLQQQVGITTIMVTHDQEEALSLADRIVVMNAGRIEQVGSPQEVYERPASPFVAEFVGKVNVLRAVALGAQRFQVGQLQLDVQGDSRHWTAGTEVNLYLRPEDRLLEHLNPDTPNRIQVIVEKIEFLGGMCHAELACAALGGQSLNLSFSLNLMHDLKLAPGRELSIALRADRIRVFPAKERAA